MKYYDMHCHLDFAPNAAQAAAQLDALGAGAFAVSVLPKPDVVSFGVSFGDGVKMRQRERRAFSQRDFCLSFTPSPNETEKVEQKPAPCSTVKWGVGLHPWWLAEGRAGEEELHALLAAIQTNTYIGEVGLDFGKTHGQAREIQLQAFEAIAVACAAVGARVLSIHSVHAADAVLDILEKSAALKNCTCIFHWFSDSGTAFTRAVHAGCYFSVGALMLRSARGREYARQIPLAQLLFETDEPAEGQPYEVATMQAQLAETCAAIAKLKGMEAKELATTVAATSRRLLGA